MHHTPPTSAARVIETLTAEFDALSPQLQRAARFVIDHPREIGVQSMRALAAKADVHPNTFVRLARAIGFEGYEAMRERFRDFMVADGIGGFRGRASWLQNLAAKGGGDAVLAQMVEATSANFDAVWRRHNAAELTKAADVILGAPRVFVLGMGSAYSLAHQFWYVARMAFDHIAPIPRHGSQPIDDLAWVGSNDVLMALTFQPYRSETMAAVRLAREQGVTLIGVTDSLSSPLARLSDQVLVAPTHTPQFFQSHAAVTALLESLIAILVSRAGDDALERIEEFHRRRTAAGLYEEPEPLASLALGER